MSMPRCISLCSGGGVSEALGSLMDVILAVEAGFSAASTFKANYPKVEVSLRDIADPKTIREAQKAVGRVDVISSGAPCQDFSCANQADRVRSGRNMLYLRAIDWVEDFQPMAFVAENVPNLTNAIQWIAAVTRLRKLGYQVAYWTLDAADFGTPQHRQRVFLIAVRAGLHLPKRPFATHGPGLLPHVSVSDALVGLECPLAEGLQGMSPKFQWLLRGIPPGKNWRWIEENLHIPGNRRRWEYIKYRYGGVPYNQQAASRLSPSEPCHTLLTAPSICRMARTVHPGCGSGDGWRVHSK